MITAWSKDERSVVRRVEGLLTQPAQRPGGQRIFVPWVASLLSLVQELDWLAQFIMHLGF